MFKAARVQAIRAGTCAARGVVLPIVARTEESGAVDSCLHCILVLVSFLCVRAGGVTTAGMGVRVCVCDGLCAWWRCNLRAEHVAFGAYVSMVSHSSLCLTPQSW